MDYEGRTLVMDKNKAVFKTKGIGPIYYINLDDQPERREFMENQFKYLSLIHI